MFPGAQENGGKGELAHVFIFTGNMDFNAKNLNNCNNITANNNINCGNNVRINSEIADTEGSL